jgi:hypothetical protein
MKYVMLKRRLGADMHQLIPIIFPNALVHSDVAEALAAALPVPVEIVSAGSVILNDAVCGGNSESLGLSAEPGDAEIINFNDYLHGLST